MIGVGVQKNEAVNGHGYVALWGEQQHIRDDCCSLFHLLSGSFLCLADRQIAMMMRILQFPGEQQCSHAFLMLQTRGFGHVRSTETAYLGF